MRCPLALAASALLLLGACDGDEPTPATDPAPADPSAESPEPESPEAESAEAEDEAPAEAPAERPGANRWPDEACARVIVVAYQGAMAAPASVSRSEEDARARAADLRTRVTEGGEDFAEVAREESDAASSGPRGGLLGTYDREGFPAIHEPIRDPVFALAVGETSDVLEAPYGFVVARRCVVEKIHTRHILVRYAGARNAPDDVTRTQAEARALATQLRAQAIAEGADFAAIARESSEDASADEGGDLGLVGRGLLAPAYEAAAWELQDGAISEVVESEFGFHVIQRIPDDEG